MDRIAKLILGLLFGPLLVLILVLFVFLPISHDQNYDSAVTYFSGNDITIINFTDSDIICFYTSSDTMGVHGDSTNIRIIKSFDKEKKNKATKRLLSPCTFSPDVPSRQYNRTFLQSEL